MDTSKYLPEIAFPRKEDYQSVYFYQGGRCLRMVKGNFGPAIATSRLQFPGAVEEVITDEESFKAARIAYATEEARLTHQFKVDCFHEAGLITNPFTGALWDLAWQRGHSAGMSEVHSIFMDLAVLDMLARRTYQTTGN